MPRTLLALCLAFALAVSGCSGWHLRGKGPEAGKVKSVMLIAKNAPQTAIAFNYEIFYNNVRSVSSRDKASAIVTISNENFERRVISVDPATGKVREIELTLEITVSVRGPGEKLLVNEQKMSWVEDFVFDEISVLGTEAQEVTTKQELCKTAARSLMLRLQTLDYDKPLPEPQRKPKPSTRLKTAD